MFRRITFHITYCALLHTESGSGRDVTFDHYFLCVSHPRTSCQLCTVTKVITYYAVKLYIKVGHKIHFEHLK